MRRRSPRTPLCRLRQVRAFLWPSPVLEAPAPPEDPTHHVWSNDWPTAWADEPATLRLDALQHAIEHLTDGGPRFYGRPVDDDRTEGDVQ